MKAFITRYFCLAFIDFTIRDQLYLYTLLVNLFYCRNEKNVCQLWVTLSVIFKVPEFQIKGGVSKLSVKNAIKEIADCADDFIPHISMIKQVSNILISCLASSTHFLAGFSGIYDLQVNIINGWVMSDHRLRNETATTISVSDMVIIISLFISICLLIVLLSGLIKLSTYQLILWVINLSSW